ncbi:phytanoyl-CoA dioxygenase family protein [Paenibacillus mendelii]|uniref:Phytanoyl-CoA dioxygenase family protein n=1 Tax=Paenibacillus mendelii TaxID=206163 RepID=A0ABV6JIG4_9BACL|nr:phytanoyl-CoA dioxygenase family protein [Paenibacillus mendelii]MCQ6557208.1 phytanoyl-CoA dioxygenase family protein [Paenibacillus mendelii]
MKVTSGRISQEDREFYKTNGYWVSPVLFDEQEIEDMRKAHDRIWSFDYDGDGFPLDEWRPNSNPKMLRKIDNSWWINDTIKNTVTNPILGQIAAGLMDSTEARLWYDQVIYKPGTGKSDKDTQASGNVGWHQDYIYWRCTNHENLVTAWIALQDTDLTNGCMSVVPGSHTWGLLEGSDAFFNRDLESVKSRIAQESGKDWKEVPLLLKAGQVSFHHAYTIHGSGQNHSDHPRLSVVAHLMPHGTAYKNRGHNVDNIRLLGPRPKEGQLFDNDYFPIAYSAETEQ